MLIIWSYIYSVLGHVTQRDNILRSCGKLYACLPTDEERNRDATFSSVFPRNSSTFNAT